MQKDKLDRRDFVKTGTVAAVAAGVVAGCSSTQRSRLLPPLPDTRQRSRTRWTWPPAVPWLYGLSPTWPTPNSSTRPARKLIWTISLLI